MTREGKMAEAQKSRDLREISIVIDTWDDIFSDFDPRPLDQRTFSEDFIHELKKRYQETRTGRILISICAPETLRDTAAEKVVIQRLKREFRRESLQSRREIRRIRQRGLIFVACGVCFLATLTFLRYAQKFSLLTMDLIGIVLMPLGWFGIWEGLSKLVDASPRFHQDEILFEKFARAEYRFKYLPSLPPDGKK